MSHRVSLWRRMSVRWIRRKIFQLQHGFDYADTWCLFLTQAEWILPRLRHFKKFTGGHPSDITQEEWEGIIGQMIRAFELSVIEGDGDILTDNEWDEVDLGHNLFITWYFHLWN